MEKSVNSIDINENNFEEYVELYKIISPYIDYKNSRKLIFRKTVQMWCMIPIFLIIGSVSMTIISLPAFLTKFILVLFGAVTLETLMFSSVVAEKIVNKKAMKKFQAKNCFIHPEIDTKVSLNVLEESLVQNGVIIIEDSNINYNEDAFVDKKNKDKYLEEYDNYIKEDCIIENINYDICNTYLIDGEGTKENVKQYCKRKNFNNGKFNGNE